MFFLFFCSEYQNWVDSCDELFINNKPTRDILWRSREKVGKARQKNQSSKRAFQITSYVSASERQVSLGPLPTREWFCELATRRPVVSAVSHCASHGMTYSTKHKLFTDKSHLLHHSYDHIVIHLLFKNNFCGFQILIVYHFYLILCVSFTIFNNQCLTF